MSFIPVTVRAIEVTLAQRQDDGVFRVHGVEPGMLGVVGVVEDLAKPGGASVEFTLNDASGRIRARYYVTEPGALDGLEQLAAGRYVSLVGNARSAPSPHFAVTCMHLVSSADEVSYHMIEVAHAALKLRKAPLALDPATPAPKRPNVEEQQLSPPKAPSDSLQTPGLAMPVQALQTPGPAAPALKASLQGADLRQATLDFIQREAAFRGAEGLSLAAVEAQLTPAAAADVRACLEGLVDEGEICNTIDDLHFAAI